MLTIEEPFKPTNFYKGICAQDKTILFFDIETTGFSREYNQIYLIGAASRKNGKWILMQWFAQSEAEEPLVIRAFLDYAKDYQILIHFNGKAFDLPFTKARANLFDIPFTLDFEESIDLMTMIKPYKKLCDMPNIKQKSVEKLLGMDTREDVMTGGELIPVYYHYLKKQDQESLRLLLLHNADDVRGMTDLTQVSLFRDFFDSPFSFDRTEALNTGVLMHFHSNARMPMLINQDYGAFSLSAAGNDLTLGLPFFDGELRHYFPDYKNYYYLPEEDMIVHKSIAEFVDKSKKEKAKRDNCFVKKACRFLPQPVQIISPAFTKERKDKQFYFEAEKEILTPEFCLEYLKEILKII